MTNIWKEKYQELKSSCAENLKKIEDLERQLSEARESKLKSESPSRKLAEGLQSLKNKKLNLRNDKEFDELLNSIAKEIDQLIDSEDQLGTTKIKKVELLKKLFAGTKDKEKLLQLEAEVESENEKIKDLGKKVKASEKELVSKCQELNLKIKKEKDKLENETAECKSKIEKNADWLDRVKKNVLGGSEIVDKNLKMLLKAQEEIVRHDSLFAVEAKKKILKELSGNSEELERYLDELCKKQTEITQLRMQLESAEKISQIVDTNSDKEAKSWGTEITIAPTMPIELLEEIKKTSNITENYDFDLAKFNCKVVYPGPENSANFLKEAEKKKISYQKELPIKLYNIKEDKVERTKGNPNIENYAILSYVWGIPGKPSDATWTTKCKDKLNPAGYKNLYKSVQVCSHLGIDYLWMDQLCIDQDDQEEKEKEVPKMGQYYNNAEVTLVAIQTSIGLQADGKGKSNYFDLPYVAGLIINSDWFKRSWTFQEGWLSKQTLFMFDDVLVNGRAPASIWVSCQPSYTGHAKFANIIEFKENNEEIATPLGRTYCKEGHSSQGKVMLGLHEALRAIKKRGRGNPVDGIYSILGLLPYGEKVEVSYSLSPQEALIKVMKIAAKEGHGVPLGWYGLGESWFPNIDESGSTSVTGELNIDYVPKNKDFNEEVCIKINGLEYVVDNGVKNIAKIEKGFLIDDGVHIGELRLETKKGEYIKVNLLGMKETLQKVEQGDILLVPNSNEWKSAKPFAILLEKKSKFYQRIGLVELFPKDVEKLKRTEEKEIIIEMSGTLKDKIKTEQTEYQAQILHNPSKIN